MKREFLWDYDHACMYLLDSIINIADKPVRINDVIEEDGGDMRLAYGPLSDLGDHDTISLSNPSVSFDSPKLGYVNRHRQKRTVRAMRWPKRQWKIGLHPRNTSLYYTRSFEVEHRANLYSLDVANTIVGKYPSFIKAMDTVTQDLDMFKEVAFSRNFAVNSDQQLFHFFEEVPVGVFKDNEIPILEDEFEYLRQTLDEDMANEN